MSPVPNNIPSHATKVTFSCVGSSGTYYVWSNLRGWVWDTGVDSGQEKTQELAEQAARDWIKYGIQGRRTNGRRNAVSS